MASKLSQKDFELNMRKIMQATPVAADEDMSVKYARIERAKKDYAFFFEHYLPMYATSKCSWFHVFIASLLAKHKIIRLLLKWFRGAAKSVHADIGWPMWLKVKGELKFMVLVGQTETKARLLLSDLQAQMMSNQRYITDFGEQFSHGTWEEGNFKTKDGCLFFALGFQQSPRGLRNEAQRPDYIVIDDVDTQEMSNNEMRVRKGTDWVCDDLMGCFDVGNQRLVVVNNAPFTHSIIGTLCDDKLKGAITTAAKKLYSKVTAPGAFTYKAKGFWHMLQVNAVDDNMQPAWPEKYTAEYWQAVKEDKTMRSWLREYMNVPVIEGKVFKNEHINFTKPLPLKEYDHLLCYFDPSYKATATADYKAIVLVGKKTTQYHILTCFVRKCSIGAAVKYMYDLNDHIQKTDSNIICNFWMEANYIQDLFLDEFKTEGKSRGYQLAIRGDKRAKPDKFTRIENLSPLFERGVVLFSEKQKDSDDIKRCIEQFLAFEQGAKAHDDAPDAVEGAVWLLNRKDKVSEFSPVFGTVERDNAY
jgi:predicted phage terminase large subunit-like protein